MNHGKIRVTAWSTSLTVWIMKRTPWTSGRPPQHSPAAYVELVSWRVLEVLTMDISCLSGSFPTHDPHGRLQPRSKRRLHESDGIDGRPCSPRRAHASPTTIEGGLLKRVSKVRRGGSTRSVHNGHFAPPNRVRMEHEFIHIRILRHNPNPTRFQRMRQR